MGLRWPHRRRLHRGLQHDRVGLEVLEHVGAEVAEHRMFLEQRMNRTRLSDEGAHASRRLLRAEQRPRSLKGRPQQAAKPYVAIEGRALGNVVDKVPLGGELGEDRCEAVLDQGVDGLFDRAGLIGDGMEGRLGRSSVASIPKLKTCPTN